MFIHIPFLLIKPKHQVSSSVNYASHSSLFLGLSEKLIMPSNHGLDALGAYASYSTFSVFSQILIKQVAVCLLAHLQPHGVVIILLDVLNLNQTDHIAVVHNRKASKPAVIEHSCFCDLLRTCNLYTGVFSFNIYFFIIQR